MRLEDFRPEVQSQIRAKLAAEDDRTLGRQRGAPHSVSEVALEAARSLARKTRAELTAGLEVEMVGRELRVRVPLRSWSLNDERARHWRERAERTRTVRGYVAWALAGQSLPGFVEPVEIEATSYGVRFDAGNDLPTVKAAVDVLVDLGVLEDDRAEFVARLILNAPVPAKDPALELRIRPHGLAK